MGFPSTTPATPATPATSATSGVGDALETIPTDTANPYRGKYIPNTPLGASIVSVCLAITFTLGLVLFLRGPIVFGSQDDRWRPLGLFLACWAGFHWGEYAVCAGWNRARCSVDCELSACYVVVSLPEWSGNNSQTFHPLVAAFLLENGREYNIANFAAVSEFVITMFVAPHLKRHTYVTYIGE